MRLKDFGHLRTIFKNYEFGIEVGPAKYFLDWYNKSDRDIFVQNHGADLGWGKAPTVWKKRDAAAWPIIQVTISHFDQMGNLDNIFLVMQKSTRPRETRVYIVNAEKKGWVRQNGTLSLYGVDPVKQIERGSFGWYYNSSSKGPVQTILKKDDGYGIEVSPASQFLD